MVSLSDFPVSDSEASLQAEALGSAEVRRAIKREAVAAQDAARAAHEEAASAAHRQPACVSGQAVVCRIEDTSASADFRKAVEQIQFEERIYRLKLQHNAELAKQAEDIERLRLGLDESQQAAGELQTELSIAQRDCEAARQAEQAATSKAVAQEVEVQHWMAGAREAAAGAERAQAAAAGLQAKMASMQEQHQQALSETQAEAVLEAASGGQKTASRHRSKHDRALRKLQAELESLRAAEEAAYEGGRSRGLDEAQSELQDRLKEYHRLLDAERADTTAALELADKAQLEARSQIARMETRLVEAEQQAASMELQCQQARCELAKALVEKSNALTQSQALLDASSDTVQKQAAELVRLENELQQHQATLSSLRSSVDTAAAKELESKLSQRDALRWAADERELAATLAAELAKKEEALAQQGAKLSCLQAALQAEEARNAALSAEVAQHKQAEMRASEDIGNVQAALQSLRRRQAEMQSVVQRTCGADVSAGVGAFPTMFPGTLPGQSWT
ncbi:hypothetical protein WJX72_011063 [[Myrmecia] bisecta]|uniref:Uncharacterized protein n=1 Tax=[Myrmecia] bisecta TaxID=41462 RepID=A0AAW1PPT9_9CHLO